MKMRIYSQWMEDVYIPVRVKQFSRAAGLLGKSSFASYMTESDFLLNGFDSDREAVAEWLDRQDSLGKLVDVA